LFFFILYIAFVDKAFLREDTYDREREREREREVTYS